MFKVLISKVLTLKYLKLLSIIVMIETYITTVVKWKDNMFSANTVKPIILLGKRNSLQLNKNYKINSSVTIILFICT